MLIIQNQIRGFTCLLTTQLVQCQGGIESGPQDYKACNKTTRPQCLLNDQRMYKKSGKSMNSYQNKAKFVQNLETILHPQQYILTPLIQCSLMKMSFMSAISLYAVP